jgi:hypothetical protein
MAILRTGGMSRSDRVVAIILSLRVQSEKTCDDDDHNHDADDVEDVHVWTPIEAGGFDTKAPRPNRERSDVNPSSTVL